MTDHNHEWVPVKVGHVWIASDMPEYFVVRVICVTEGCDETALGVTEAQEA